VGVVSTRRVGVLVAAVGVAVAVVGLSTAATMSARGDAPQRTKPTRATPAVSPAAVVGSPETQAQAPDAAASYWTKERMQNAKPQEKTVAGPSRPSTSSVPSSGGKTSPSTHAKARTPAKKPAQERAAQTGGPASHAPDADANAADYWDQDRMDDAQPIEQNVDGDAGGGSSGVPGSGGGSTAPPP
jgi:hypothetical protein